MPRLFTRRQALQNAAFLEALRRTGNPRLAARLLGVHRSTYTKRRAKSAAFALDWDAALAAAHAAFHESGGPRPPEQSSPAFAGEGERACEAGLGGLPTAQPDAEHRLAKCGGGASSGRDPRSRTRTRGGELCVGRTRGGRLQLRRAPAGWMTKKGEQAFFRALSATANVRLSAAAAGFAHSAFYQKRRRRPAFAREMRLSLGEGYDRIEAAALAAALPESHEDDAWRHNDPPPIPPMTADQALQLLFLHEKSVRQSWDQPHRRKRRGESWEIYGERLRAMWMSEKAREAEDAAVRAAARAEGAADWDVPEEEEDLPALPDLSQVKGWSKAKPQVSTARAANTDGARRPTGRRSRARLPVLDPDPGSRHDGALTEQPHGSGEAGSEAGPVYNPELGLFGGWRLKDWKKREGKR